LPHNTNVLNRMSAANARFPTPSEAPLLSIRDIFLLAYLPALALVAWSVPEQRWPGICARLTRIQARTCRGIGTRAQHIAALLAREITAADAERISRMLAENYHYARLQIIRMHRFRYWEPPKKVIGIEHLQRALSQGRGAVLWVAPFVFSDVMTKMTLFRSGFAAVQLSSQEHGFSASRLGSRSLNAIWTSVEDRYISERVLITADKVLHGLSRRLRTNEIVAITAVMSRGQRTATARFFSGRLRIAGGAPVLAKRSAAPLLPVFTVRDDTGTFVTTIESPLHTTVESGHDVLTGIAEQWTARLAPHVLDRPEQFLGWNLATTN
jgi:lauroyl/myristoyl acyltransferase